MVWRTAEPSLASELREEQRGAQLQHARSGLADVAEATAAISLVLVDGGVVELAVERVERPAERRPDERRVIMRNG